MQKLDKLADILIFLSGTVIVLVIFAFCLRVKALDPEPFEPEVTVPIGPIDMPTQESMSMSLHAPDATPELDQAQTYRDNVPLPYELQDALYAACDEFGVGLDIMLGPIEVECGFDVNADNGICYGPCQLNRNYFPDGLTSGENIRAGVEYLGQLLARYNTVEAAPTAYNAGHDTGDRAYANAVLSAAEKWRA